MLRRKSSLLELLYLVVFPNKVVSEIACLEFFLCFKMDGSYIMTKLNSLNYSTLKHMMKYLLYCKDLHMPIKLEEKPSDTFYED